MMGKINVPQEVIHVFFLCDISGSMQGRRLSAVNKAVSTVLQYLQQYVVFYPHKQCYINTICFSSQAYWHVSAAPLADCYWLNINKSGGLSDLGKAYKLLASRLKVLASDEEQQPPIIILLSDGKPTDDADVMLDNLLKTSFGYSSQRIAIGIGHDIDMDCLKQFHSNQQISIKVTNSLHDLTFHLAKSLKKAIYQLE